jgi:RNA polymerase sigma factor (TIGR02999 family)
MRQPPGQDAGSADPGDALPRAWTADDERAVDQLLPLVYDELRRLAHARLMGEPAGHTLTTTALVHEAYLRLADQSRVTWTDHGHFLAVASVAMRRVLIDYARKHRAAKRGGDRHRVDLHDADLSVQARADRLLELDDALTRLAAIDERLSRVVECRFFGGLTEEETAAAMGVTSRTVRSHWAAARGILHLELSAS